MHGGRALEDRIVRAVEGLEGEALLVVGGAGEEAVLEGEEAGVEIREEGGEALAVVGGWAREVPGGGEACGEGGREERDGREAGDGERGDGREEEEEERGVGAGGDAEEREVRVGGGEVGPAVVGRAGGTDRPGARAGADGEEEMRVAEAGGPREEEEEERVRGGRRREWSGGAARQGGDRCCHLLLPPPPRLFRLSVLVMYSCTHTVRELSSWNRVN
jgi:hypothetical protein